MSREMRLPELGENIETAEVTAVLVSEGEKVQADQALIELETDKATAEVPSAFAGTVRSLHVSKGDQVRVGQVIVTLDEGVSEASPAPSAAETATAPPASGSEAPENPAPVVEAATAPATPAPEPAPPAAPSEPMAQPEPEQAATPPAAQGPAGGPASPVVRRLARELGVDLAAVQGSGRAGRISEADVKGLARSVLSGEGQTVSPLTTADGSLPDFSRWGPVHRQPLTAVRRAIAANMARAWSTVPQVTQFDRADVTELDRFRRRYGDRAMASGGKLTMTAIIVKLAAAALRTFPVFNSSLDSSRGEIIYKDYVHIGVAVDTEHGLLVPVLRDAGLKSLVALSAELSDLAERTRRRKVGIEELQGATFTISNLGGLGTTYFSPIVNWPQVAILGVGRSRREAVELDGSLVARSILPLSISYDHRVIDGADAARFLRWLAEALENPLLTMLEGSTP